MNSAPPTIRDIAKMAGVSIATVSYVLNGTGTVGGSTRERILLVIESTGYVPNSHARDLARARVNKRQLLSDRA